MWISFQRIIFYHLKEYRPLLQLNDQRLEVEVQQQENKVIKEKMRLLEARLKVHQSEDTTNSEILEHEELMRARGEEIQRVPGGSKAPTIISKIVTIKKKGS